MNLKKKVAAVLCSAMLVVAAAGCGSDGAKQAKPETKADSKTAITFTDLEKRNVKLAKMPQRIVVGDYLLNYLAVGGAKALDKVVGMTMDGWEDVRYGESQVFSAAFPKLKKGNPDRIPSIGGYHNNVLNIEKIMSLKPDVLLIDKTQFRENNQNIDLLEKAGIKVVVLDYHAETVENHTQSTEILGKLLGREKTAKEQNDAYKKAFELVDKRVAAIPAAKKNRKVFMEIGNKGAGEMGNSYRNILWGSMITRAGGKNLGDTLKGTYGVLDQEYVTSQNPDVIIIGGSIWAKDTKGDQMRMGFTVPEDLAQKRLAGFASKPEWQNLKAIKNNEVYGVDHGSLRTMVDYTFLEYIAKILYPDEFKDIDPIKEMNDFYAKYLPEVKYTGTFMIHLKK